MYNRYIPQPDGSYSRRRMQESSPTPPPPRQEQRPREEQWQPEPENTAQEAKSQFTANPRQQCRRNPCRQRPSPRPIPPPKQEFREQRQNSNSHKQETNVLSFLKQLLPKDFDTGDLLIVLLLLLMSGDCHEDQNTAILTLVLYLFL